MKQLATDPAYVAEPTVEITKLSKWFGQKVAVSDVSCSFGPGITGLLGPNGAGKTTLLRVLTGLALPSEGTATILGKNPRRDTAVYGNVGLVPEEPAVYGALTARTFVEYAGKLSKVADPQRAALKALTDVDLMDSIDRPLSGFSKGMRQRAKVAAALVHKPSILVLDEPLNGTDPVQRAHLIRLFRKLANEGRTVIVSSHVLQEVERMTDRVIAMVDGKLAAAGDIAAIRSAMTDIPYRVLIEADEPRKLAASLLQAEDINGITMDGARLHVETGDLSRLGNRLPGLVRELGLRITTFKPEDESLESIFRYLVRRR